MKRRMNKNSPVSNAFCAALLLMGVIWSCSIGDEGEKANKLVNEGNAAIDEGKKLLADAEDKKNKMLQTNVSQLGEARTLANEAIRTYDQVEAKAKEAAAKYDEASKLKINDKFKEYLTLKVKEYNKRAEFVETLKAVPQALIDSQNRASFLSRANEATQNADKLNKEADDFEAQADKVEKENPESFAKK